MLIKPPAKYAEGFWTKAFEWKGIYVLGNRQVPDEAVYRAAEIVFNSIAMVNPKIVTALAKYGARFVVIPQEVTDITKLPNYDDLPSVPWGAYRGLGGVIGRPTSSSGEENLLKLPGDPYNGSESIGLHEWLHAVEGIGLATAFPALHNQFKAAYQNALNTSLWQNTYAASTFYEYFAETGQAHFSDNPNVTPTNGIHNDINTRLELMGYDQTAYNLHAQIFGLSKWTVGSNFGSAARNVMVGGPGADLIFGNGHHDRLSGLGGGDRLVGGLGNDQIRGDAGDDVLEGNLGIDRLSGGAGRDVFMFNSVPNARTNFDLISDFNTNQDKIHLENQIFRKLGKEGALKEDFFALTTDKDKDGNDYIQYNPRTGTLIYDVDGVGPRAGIKFATLLNKPIIDHLDFAVI
ncbi:MAG: calcium-binding protein [Rhizobiaceae bacterium]|nr:calcium-binding protein [Rhizobiaceae bacterium]